MVESWDSRFISIQPKFQPQDLQNHNLRAQGHSGHSWKEWAWGGPSGIPGCPGLASELTGRAPHRRLTAAGARAPSWQGRFHSLAHAPGWEMIHENQEGKISPEAAE